MRLASLLFLVVAACPTVDTGETPVTPGSCRPSSTAFQEQIWPTAIAPPDQSKSCVVMMGCHAQADGRSSLRLIPAPASPSDWSQNYDVVTRFLNCATPDASSFITKPRSGIDTHGGGDLWTCDSTCEPIMTVEAWIAGS